ncbi:MAG: AAA family ATPase, partial [Deltaproteobacteria bacterium]|nr:AAA family ATPase [Deltaproteobacteria bacterium]
LGPLRAGGDFVKVLDFGLAQFRATLQTPGAGRITSPGIVCGTPEYMSPEQARGSNVDHRSDLYSLGVVLFELLTGRLPFQGESLQEIVRRQMIERPPDPRTLLPPETADEPERKIPVPLVDLLNRVLSKNVEERPQSAEEFYAALRAAVTPNDRPAEVACGSCGGPVPRRQQFCGHCGATMARKKLTVVPPPKLLAEPPELPVRGRDDELRWLYSMCSRATDSVVAAVLAGAPGTGRTRLATELLRERERLGDRVVSVGPDPWGAGVHWHSAREAIYELADLRDVPAGASSFYGASAEARAGLQLLLSRHDAQSTFPDDLLSWHDTAPYRPLESDKRILVAEALRWALSFAATRNQGRVILLVDDLATLDGASRNAFADLVTAPPAASALVIGVAPVGYPTGWTTAEYLHLDGIAAEQGAHVIEAIGDLDGEELPGFEEATRTSGKIAPLHLEQLLRFAAEGGHHPPEKLASLVATRIASLQPDTRRILQAIAVLGDAAASTQLVALLPDVASFGEHLARLRERSWIVTRDGEHMVAHPWLREFVAGATPTALREELHARARHDFGDKALELPLEARAFHAYHAGDAAEAAVLLERVAARCAELGDLEGRVTTLSRALEMARRQMGRSVDDTPLAAMLVLAGKLGDALLAVDRPTHAIGVLREALELTPPSAPERARLLASLAAATRDQGQLDIANGHLQQAIRAARLGRNELLADSLERMLASWSP